jgi:hypothetical protein
VKASLAGKFAGRDPCSDARKSLLITGKRVDIWENKISYSEIMFYMLKYSFTFKNISTYQCGNRRTQGYQGILF